MHKRRKWREILTEDGYPFHAKGISALCLSSIKATPGEEDEQHALVASDTSSMEDTSLVSPDHHIWLALYHKNITHLHLAGRGAEGSIIVKTEVEDDFA